MPLSEVSMPPPLKGQLAAFDPIETPVDGLMYSRNVISRFGRVMARPGFVGSGASATSATALGMVQYDRELEKDSIVVFFNDGWYRYDKNAKSLVFLGPWVDDQGQSYDTSKANHVTSRIYELDGKPWLLAVNEDGVPNAWNGQDSSEPVAIGGSPPAAVTCIGIAGDRVLLGIGKEIWTSELPGLGGFNAGWGNIVDRLADTPGDIVAMAEFGAQSIAVFKTDAIYLGVTTSSATEPTAFRLVVAHVPGPASPRSIANLPDGSKAYLAVDGTLRIFDGNQTRPISVQADAHIQKYAEVNRLRSAFVSVANRYSELHVVYPPKGETDRLEDMVISLSNGSVWPISFPQGYEATAALEVDSRGAPRLGDLSGTLASFGSKTLGSFTDVEEEMAFMLRSKQAGNTYLATYDGEFDNPDEANEMPIKYEMRTGLVQPFLLGWGTLRQIEFLFDGTPDTLFVEVLTSDHGEGEGWGTSKTIAPSLGRKILARLRMFGRFFGVRIFGHVTTKVAFMGAVSRGHARGSSGGDRFKGGSAWQ